jgi:hypothetical protein
MPPVKKPSRRNIGGRVNDDFSRLAYFRSEMSLASSRFDSVDSDDLSDGYADIVEAADTDGRIRWVKVQIGRVRRGRKEVARECKIVGL